MTLHDWLPLVQVLELMTDNLLDKFTARSVDQMIQRLRQGRGKQYQLGKSGM
jgi:type II secretory pathway component PulF